MKSMQQQEALDYFGRFAVEWRDKAEGSIPQRVNVIKQRNNCILEVARKRSYLKYYLDVGCGTGELVCELAKSGVRAVGVDFAPEMIELCDQKVKAEGIAGAEFVHASIFDFKPLGVKFDLLSANGFIEYISEKQLLEFIIHAKTLLAPAGSLVVGSRNRLFNAFSLNEYTRIEIDKGTFPKLIAEAMIIANATTTEECIEQLLQINEFLPSLDRHPFTGIEVTVRHQYTPGQLVRLFKKAGLKSIGLLPIHYHAAIPRFAQEHPDVNVAIADLMQGYAPDCHYLTPFASSFMLHADLT